jgi:hypothetical protein
MMFRKLPALDGGHRKFKSTLAGLTSRVKVASRVRELAQLVVDALETLEPLGDARFVRSQSLDSARRTRVCPWGHTPSRRKQPVLSSRWFTMTARQEPPTGRLGFGRRSDRAAPMRARRVRIRSKNSGHRGRTDLGMGQLVEDLGDDLLGHFHVQVVAST